MVLHPNKHIQVSLAAPCTQHDCATVNPLEARVAGTDSKLTQNCSKVQLETDGGLLSNKSANELEYQQHLCAQRCQADSKSQHQGQKQDTMLFATAAVVLENMGAALILASKLVIYET